MSDERWRKLMTVWPSQEEIDAGRHDTIKILVFAAVVTALSLIASKIFAGEPLYFPTVNVAPKIEPSPLATTAAVRDVVILVPDFPCNACIWWDKTVLPQVKGIRVTKRVDMETRDGWPQLYLPDTGRTWFYYHPVTKKPLTAANIEAILRQFPPVEKPQAKRPEVAK